jgi:hypothetical protein
MMEPIIATWNGEAFVPAQRHAKACDATFVVGARYAIEAQPLQSEKERRFFHAQLTEIWRSLPEEIAERWPTVESFRKAGLIACGYCHKTEAVCATNQQATALAASYARLDDYVVVEIRDRVISIWTAKSQKRSAMTDPEERKAANRAVLEWAAAQVGVTREQAERSAA